jgi:hypothetical protein
MINILMLYQLSRGLCTNRSIVNILYQYILTINNYIKMTELNDNNVSSL